LSLFVACSGARLRSLGTPTNSGPIVPSPDDDDEECGAAGGMTIGRARRNQKYSEKTSPMPFCPPQIGHGLTWVGARAAASRSLSYGMA
jgi:hypothetical protein